MDSVLSTDIIIMSMIVSGVNPCLNVGNKPEGGPIINIFKVSSLAVVKFLI